MCSVPRKKPRWQSPAFASLLGVVLAAVAVAPPAAAQNVPLRIELNRLEPRDKGCRIDFVIDSPSGLAFEALKLDLIFFGPDAVIAQRLAVDLGPLRADKRSVKSFDLDSLACSRVSSILVNDVLDCRVDAGPVADCLGRIAVSSRAAATLAK